MVFQNSRVRIFRELLIDAYSHRCAMTGEFMLLVLQAAHIKPYPLVQWPELSNGLLLRSDRHTLFDQGYVTVDTHDHKIVVSNRIKEEFGNGKDYFKLVKMERPTLVRSSAGYAAKS